MIKILLVDDDSEKHRVITKVVLEVPGIEDDSIDHVYDVVAAKKAIRSNRYDLVILDINLARNSNSGPEVGAGLDVLHFIKNNNHAKRPGCLFGLTAFDDGAEIAASEFSSPLWKLMRFSYTELSWCQPLKEALIYLQELNKPPFTNDGKNYHYDLAIFTAIQEELDSLLSLSSWTKITVPYDHADYYETILQGPDGSLKAVATVAPRMGMPSAAVSSSKLIHNFRPKYLAIVGICAGVRGKSELGDILIADPCFDWGSGKWQRETESGVLRFRPATYQWRLDESLRAAAKSVASDEKFLRDLHYNYEGKKPTQRPEVHIEAMASGASVLQATSLMEDVRDLHKNLVGVEMESYAVFTAAQHAAEPRPLCISVKSVCDFGDETKSDDVHHYAAHTSSAFLIQLAKLALVEPTI
ncbi:hypothetical protein [Pseudomonas putida]|uniref:phosphorylase family protein n=1 Tax=Pseudomonas putida TaxID=303 RepID=UPI003D957D47